MNIDHNVSKQTNISQSIIFFKVQYQYALMSINLSAKNLSHHPQSSACLKIHHTRSEQSLVMSSMA